MFMYPQSLAENYGKASRVRLKSALPMCYAALVDEPEPLQVSNRQQWKSE